MVLCDILTVEPPDPETVTEDAVVAFADGLWDDVRPPVVRAAAEKALPLPHDDDGPPFGSAGLGSSGGFDLEGLDGSEAGADEEADVVERLLRFFASPARPRTASGASFTTVGYHTESVGTVLFYRRQTKGHI